MPTRFNPEHLSLSSGSPHLCYSISISVNTLNSTSIGPEIVTEIIQIFNRGFFASQSDQSLDSQHSHDVGFWKALGQDGPPAQTVHRLCFNYLELAIIHEISHKHYIRMVKFTAEF